jgi:hypothetical protein
MAVALSIEPGLMTKGFIARRLKEVALLAALIGLAIGTYYVVQYGEMLVLFSSIVGSHDVVEDSVANERGDKVKASTETSGDQQTPARTVLRLRRAHHWFSTTLLETESYGFQWDAEWRDDDIVDLYIGFGASSALADQLPWSDRSASSITLHTITRILISTWRALGAAILAPAWRCTILVVCPGETASAITSVIISSGRARSN